MKLIFGVIAAAFLLAPISAQAKCRYCATGQGSSPRGQGYAECRVNLPLPNGATKLAVQLRSKGRDIWDEPRVAFPVNGYIVIGCSILDGADELVACAEWGEIKKTTTLYRRNGRLDRAVADRQLIVPF